MRKVSIVGAGPGAIDLLTQRAINRIKDAEVIVWADSLVSPEIINLAPANCELIKSSNLTLEKIMEIIIQRHRQSKKIVRLHDGDPSLYGAISEQIRLLNDSGIEVEVIPGISAYQATAANLKAELTIPNVSQTIVLSRFEGKTGMPESESLDRLASLKASLCLYLSARHIEEVEAILLKHYPPETPVAIGYRVSWPDEFLELIALKDMANRSKAKKLFRTTLYIISPALSKNSQRSNLYSPDYNHLFRP
tara:strand:+ start:120 stop:869 length:750 start_codon:yes stop_codon:yes gene_type:complete